MIVADTALWPPDQQSMRSMYSGSLRAHSADAQVVRQRPPKEKGGGPSKRDAANVNPRGRENAVQGIFLSDKLEKDLEKELLLHNCEQEHSLINITTNNVGSLAKLEVLCIGHHPRLFSRA